MTVVRDRPVDLDAEQEVDLGGYGRTLAARWWLLALGLVAGAIVGYLLSLGGGAVYRAQTLVYLGQPLGLLGSSQAQSLNTTASARAIVASESALQRASRASGIPLGKLRGGVTATPAGASNSKIAQTSTLMNIVVKGPKPAKARIAADVLARAVIARMSGYATAKMRLQRQELAADRAAIESLTNALAVPGKSLDTKLLLQMQLSTKQQDATQTAQLLTLARNVEAPRILTQAAASKATARSHRSSTIVGAVIGLILGAIAALMWDSLPARRRAR